MKMIFNKKKKEKKEENEEKTLKHKGTAENFLNRTPITYALRSRIDKWDLIKLQSFCKTKDTVNRKKCNEQIGKRFYQPYIG